LTADRYLDAAPGLLGGYAVVLVCGVVCHGQALFDTAHDVAACAALMGVAVLTSDETLIDACRALGVATALPPPFDKRRWPCKAFKEVLN